MTDRFYWTRPKQTVRPAILDEILIEIARLQTKQHQLEQMIHDTRQFIITQHGNKQ
jgi:hypothetical protein